MTAHGIRRARTAIALIIMNASAPFSSDCCANLVRFFQWLEHSECGVYYTGFHHFFCNTLCQKVYPRTFICSHQFPVYPSLHVMQTLRNWIWFLDAKMTNSAVKNEILKNKITTTQRVLVARTDRRAWIILVKTGGKNKFVCKVACKLH